MPQIIAPPENKTTEKRPIITTCPNCQYTISYTEDEVERVGNEAMGFQCPQCGAIVETKKIKPFTFPDTFFGWGQEDSSKRLTDEEIQKYVNMVAKHFPYMKVGEYYPICSANVMVMGIKDENDEGLIQETIYVFKDYYEEYILEKK